MSLAGAAPVSRRFTEHHFVDDGDLSGSVPVSGAMAAATGRVRFGTEN